MPASCGTCGGSGRPSASGDESGALWQRFKSAADELPARCDEQARLVAAEQAVHLQARVALCESAEALAQSTEWVATAETLKQLQAQWAAAGPSAARPGRGAGPPLPERVRHLSLTRRKANLASLKQAWSENASKKEALCAQAEALAESTDLAGALTGIKQLQADWKAVGPVRRNRAELLWKRFRAACDKFFERYGSRHQIAEQQRVEQREGLVQQIEALAAEVAAGTLPENIAATVQDLWTQWQNGAGLSGEAGAALRARFDAALHAVVGAAGEAFAGSRFDVSAQVARRTALCDEVERPWPARRSRPRPVRRRRRRWRRCCANRSPPTPSADASTRRQAARRGGQGPAGAAAVARFRAGLRRGGGGARGPLPPRRAPLLRSAPRAAPCAVRRAAPGRSAASRRWGRPDGPRGDCIVAVPADRPVGEVHGRTAVRARRVPTAIRVPLQLATGRWRPQVRAARRRSAMMPDPQPRRLRRPVGDAVGVLEAPDAAAGEGLQQVDRIDVDGAAVGGRGGAKRSSPPRTISPGQRSLQPRREGRLRDQAGAR